MIRNLLIPCALLALTACNPGGIASAPAPLERTTIDEKAVTLAAQSVDAVALSVTALVKAGVIKPGTPTAIKIASALDTARDAVNTAEKARQAGSATNYLTAIARANAAVSEIKAIIAKLGA